jgi:hypothetical protein
MSSELIDEAALRLSSLPDTTGLFVRAINQGYDIVLYDPKAKNAYATITISQRDYLGPNYFVSGVAAERGFGPIIYEAAMMLMNKEDKGLMPSRDGQVTGEAFGVWKNFYKRTDVKKKEIKPKDEFFSYEILGDSYEFESEEEFKEFWDEIDSGDRSALKVFNTVYYMTPDYDYNTLINRAQDWEARGFDKSIAIQAGEALWDEYINR